MTVPIQEVSDTQQRPLGDALRRRRPLIIALTLTGVLLGWLIGQTQADTYTSSVRVLVRPLIGNPFAPDTGASAQQVTIAMETEAEVVNSEAVATLAAKDLPQPWVPGSGTVTATVPPNTQILVVAFQGSSAEEAQNGARATASAYLQQRSDIAEETQAARLGFLSAQAKTVRKQLDRASRDVASFNPSPGAAQRVQLFVNELVPIRNNINALEGSIGSPGSRVAAATLPTAPNGLASELVAILGGLLGLVLGCALAIWLEQRDKRLRSGDAAEVLGVPVVASMTSGSSLAARTRRGRSAWGERQVEFDERLRTLMLAKVESPGLLALSAVTDDWAAAVSALRVSLSLAAAGYRVTLVSSDGSGVIEEYFQVSAGPGLEAALRSRLAVSDFLVDVDGLRILPAGNHLLAASARLSSVRFRSILSDLRSQSDYVIVSAPSATTPAGMAVAAATHHVLLIGSEVGTSREDVAGILRAAHQVQVDILGIAVTALRSVAESLPTRTTAAVTGASVAAEVDTVEESADSGDTFTPLVR